ncbi:hypothetical protein TRFO_17831 [Tritrichomonas foetus]|uniref:CDT1 Geminin-binding domain-containing protein n=1 Tax=Tritrichomonas foetus TaxID=1144522 RepID=A0A1J4KMA3_9EUKA|nr:hypothetical protein TRFO_17831 [Tritrichomonas foetus]|eukprot:OHT12355.1 hypothetical protein TRFO_17831 [Tritrichomonas foetus]
MNLDHLDASRFEYLLQDSRSEAPIKHSDLVSYLPLPERYEIIFSQTKALLTILKTYLMRRQVSNLSKVRDVVERQTRHTFNQISLCKCVRILPEGAITLQWYEDKRRNLPHQLHINLVSGEPIPNLVEYARNYLTDIVRSEHNKFLNSIGQRPPKEVRVWHHQFDIETCPEIIPVDLKPPEITKQVSLAESLQPYIKQKLSASEIPFNESEQQVPKSCQNLSNYFDLVKKVQEKVHLNQTLFSIGANKQNEEVLKMADIFNLSFSSLKKRSIPLKDLVASIKKNKTFSACDDQKILSLADDLISKSDGYFTKLRLSGNDYIKIDERRSYQSVRGPIYRAVMAIDA